MNLLVRGLAALLLVVLGVGPAAAEDGYDLWLRYRPLDAAARAKLGPQAGRIVIASPQTPTVKAAAEELQRGLQGMLGKAPAVSGDGGASGAAPTAGTGASAARRAAGAGAIVLASREAALKAGVPAAELDALGAEGYLLRALQSATQASGAARETAQAPGGASTIIAANSDIGLLYGAFAWLRAAQTAPQSLSAINEQSQPKLQLRVLNHWDNLDRTVERGYAGESIWHWWDLPDVTDQRYIDYARANASIGINGTVLNNVNSKKEILTAPWIAKVAKVADVLRPYGIKVYLSARFSTPYELKETQTADPLDPQVAAWWKAKADEIYKSIPDFGGFLVKANSEGQPGPQDYHRSHADGANMLAAAVAPHQGIVMWRAFVYAAEKPDDRAKQAYSEFKPLDGKFAPNVLVQVKNGAIDFQPREPFHPLFGAMDKTPLMMEFQITKEYLGYSTHLAYLGTMYEETLQSNTHTRGNGPTVADALEQAGRITGMAGVANIGSARNWSGSHFDQANWYAYGRLAWDPQGSARAIAGEWAAQTFGQQAAPAIVEIMMMSREAVVDYMTPLGLHHVMGTGHHHGPAPWVDNLGRPDWNPVYYHKADKNGIGFDRTATGSNALSQYAPEIAKQYADPRTTPQRDLLWFHHLPWDYRMPGGRTLWAELIAHYDHGVQQAADMQRRWQKLKPLVDQRRYEETAQRLARQLKEAQWWRDASIAYFQSVNGLPLPAGVKAPPQTLEYYKSLTFPYAPGHG